MTLRLPQPLWILTAAVVFGVVAVGLRVGVPAYRQGAAIREIERLGGHVTTEKWLPDWLSDRLGHDRAKLFDIVTGVSLRGSRASDTSLRSLRGLPDVRWIDVGDTAISAAGLESLTAFRKLEVLFCHNTRIDDDSIAQLKTLTGLRVLFLDDTPLTDEGLVRCKELPNLNELHVQRTQVTDHGIATMHEARPRLTLVK